MEGRKKILIVDGDQVLAREMRELLEQRGFAAEVAYTAGQAGPAFDFFQPDLVVTEILLERHDAGLDLIRRIRRHPILGRTPVLVWTAAAERTGAKFSLAEDGYWLKADGLVGKTVPPAELVARIEALIGTGGAAR